ncbi:YpsA SLOG family protein [Desulfonatronum parangueonense]
MVAALKLEHPCGNWCQKNPNLTMAGPDKYPLTGHSSASCQARTEANREELGRNTDLHIHRINGGAVLTVRLAMKDCNQVILMVDVQNQPIQASRQFTSHRLDKILVPSFPLSRAGHIQCEDIFSCSQSQTFSGSWFRASSSMSKT